MSAHMEVTDLTPEEVSQIEEGASLYNRDNELELPLVFGVDTGLDASAVRWPDDARNPNTRHLATPISTQTFTFTAEQLRQLCALNRFQIAAGQDLVLFGLRGCRIDGDDVTPFSDRITLAEDTPDHTTPRCVIGVWRRSTAEIAAFRANTVPSWRYVSDYMAGGDGANMLPTGLYRYKVGPHRAMPGALRLAESGIIVVRPDKKKSSISFETTDLWDGPCAPFDNIHPTFAVKVPMGSIGSAGCQTVPGYWDKTKRSHGGNWATFRQLSGVVGAADGAPYTYVLFTGREARLVAGWGASGQLSRLRFGSSGPDVASLQRALGLGADGFWGAATSRAIITWQWKNLGGWADAIVTPEMALRLGFRMA